MNRIAIKTIGCRLNQAESEDLARELRRRGFVIVGPKESGDVLVINTCAVTNAAVRKSRQALREFKNRNLSSRIVVLGCGVDYLKDLPEADIFIKNSSKDQAATIITDKLFAGMDLQATGQNTQKFGPQRARPFVKIQEGCADNCSYCIVPKLRGKPRSLPAPEILEKISSYCREGKKEVVLTGVHIGQYNFRGIDLPDLVNKILQQTDVHRLRLSSIEPQHLNDEIIGLFKSDRMCPFLHIPVQNASAEILNLMERRYGPADLRDLFANIKQSVPGIFLSTDIIVGFPGETDSDFRATYDFCREMGFAKIHVFRYSKREGTKAVSLPNQVSAEVKKQRAEKLRELSDKLSYNYYRQFLGKELEVIFETANTGVSKNGFKIFVPGGFPINSLYKVKVTKVTSAKICGQIIAS